MIKAMRAALQFNKLLRGLELPTKKERDYIRDCIRRQYGL